MTIISIEGASAVGKTTTSAAVAAVDGGFHIPEVAAWWKKPARDYPEWFFERQADRWEIAVKRESSHPVVVIDIDLFQPFWYNWSFHFKLFNGQSLDFVRDFYRPLLVEKRIGFPDQYFLLYASESKLRERKANDTTRKRRGFESNIKFIQPQKRYFQALNDFYPGLVHFIESETIEQNARKIQGAIPYGMNEHRYSLELFDYIIDWLSNNQAYEVILEDVDVP